METEILAQLTDERENAREEADAFWELLDLAKKSGAHHRTIRIAREAHRRALERYQRALVAVSARKEGKGG